MKRVHILSAAALLATGALLPASGAAHAQRAAGAYRQATILASLENGGVYRSVDGGQSWQESDDGLPTGTDVNALQAAGASAAYAGTNGQGVYRSVDGGQSWQDDNGDNGDLAAETVVGLAADPRSGDTVFAAGVSGTVYISYSAGQEWTESPVGTSSNLTVIADDPADPRTLLVGTQADGIYISTDAGADWQAASGIPSNVSVSALAFAPRNSQVAYAATDNGIYQSIDGGNTWLPEDRGLPGNLMMDALAVDPFNGSTVVVGTGDGTIYRSTDGGTSWQYVETLSNGAVVSSLIFDPSRPGTAYAGALDGTGIYIGSGSGLAWWPAYGFAPYEGVLSLAALSGPALPTAPESPIPNSPFAQYFPQSQHIVSGPFLSFFNKYGGVKIFGLPLTGVFAEDGHIVQYFERARLVLAGGGVQVSPLGEQVTSGRYFPPVAPFPSTASHLYFAATGHSLSGRFLAFWRTHHGALLFGAPISQPLYEQNGDGTGRTYLVQYFQNARLEYHPELAGSSYAVSIGLLGQQVLKERGWL